MSNRDWFSLALRLFGIWLLIKAIEEFVPFLLVVVSEYGETIGFAHVAGFLAWVLVRSVFGLGLLAFAPAIAARLYPGASSGEALSVEDEVKPLKIGMQLLGVYAVLLAVQAASGVIVGFMSGERLFLDGSINFSGTGSGYVGSLLTVGLNLAFAAIAIIWNEQVVALLAKLRYVPERDAYEPPPLSE